MNMDKTIDEQAKQLYPGPDNYSHQLAYKYGYKMALRVIREEITACVVNKLQFPLMHLLNFIHTQLEEDEKQENKKDI